MANRFDDALTFLFAYEGGYVNDPRDAGGETKYGISKRSYPDLDIAGLTQEDARNIYRRDFWDKLGCENLPSPLDVAVFDTGVNMGTVRALKLLSKCEGNWRDYLMERIGRYLEIAGKNPSLVRFIRGWLNRVYALYRLCKQIEKTEQGKVSKGGLSNGEMLNA